jgi:hypothetical protein
MRTLLARWVYRLWMIPHWIAWPLVLLGVWYVVLFPFRIDWYGYGLSLALAAGYGAWARRRFRVTVLEHSDRGVVYWVRRVEKGKQEATEKPPSAVLTPPQYP